MVDEHHGDRAARASDQLGELRQLVGVEAAGGLVEQQQLGLGDQRAGERDAFLDGVGQRARQAVGDIAQPSRVEGAIARSRSARSSRSERGSASSALANRARRKRWAPTITFSSTVRLREQPDPLERAGDPERGQPIGADPSRAAPAPAERAASRA